MVNVQCNYLSRKELHMEYCMHHFLLEEKQILLNPPSNYSIRMVQTFANGLQARWHTSTHIAQPTTSVILYNYAWTISQKFVSIQLTMSSRFLFTRKILSSKQFNTWMDLLLIFQKRLNGILVAFKTTEHCRLECCLQLSSPAVTDAMNNEKCF